MLVVCMPMKENYSIPISHTHFTAREAEKKFLKFSFHVVFFLLAFFFLFFCFIMDHLLLSQHRDWFFRKINKFLVAISSYREILFRKLPIILWLHHILKRCDFVEWTGEYGNHSMNNFHFLLKIVGKQGSRKNVDVDKKHLVKWVLISLYQTLNLSRRTSRFIWTFFCILHQQ